MPSSDVRPCMNSALDDLLDTLGRGEMRLADACTALSDLASGAPDGARVLAETLEDQIRSRQIAWEAAEALRSALRTSAPSTAVRVDKPTMMGTRVRLDGLANETLIRAPGAEATKVHLSAAALDPVPA